MKDAYILSACRTPIGKYMGALSPLSAPELGAVVVREALRRSGLPAARIDEVIMGNVLGAGLGQNPARQSALKAGLPVTVAALTVNKVCGSGLKAVGLAAQGIRVGDTSAVIAGGMESMTNAPYLLLKARTGYRLGNGEVVDAMIHDGLWDAYENYHMGCTGEVIACKYNVSRQDQDEFAYQSQRRALDAMASGKFKAEITPVELPAKKGTSTLVSEDEGPRKDISLEALARLKPVFKDDGCVTAGNASQISDGAAALVVASEEAVKESQVSPLARVVAFATSGVEPSMVMMAPVEAIRGVMRKAGW